MTRIRVQLVNKGEGVAEGPLQGHPAASMTVRTQRVPGDRLPPRLAIELYDHSNRVGSGTLEAACGWWRGTCTEYAGSWHVSGRIGSGALTFEERPSR